MSRFGRVDLLSLPRDPAAWRAFTIPCATPAVATVRLHRDPASRASVTLVWFPPGWRRTETGHYLAGEEFVVLSGTVIMSARSWLAGDWVWVPPGVSREDTCTPNGALVLAWFSGPAVWRGELGYPAALTASRRLRVGPLRPPTPGVPGESRLINPLRTDPARRNRDLLAVTSFEWTFVPAGEPAPAMSGPVLERDW